MRSEQEMMDLILRVAGEDDRVRAVVLNGSRANPRARKDRFQDYDIVYYVTDVDSYISDPAWIDVFGERIILQTPDAMSLSPSEWEGTFAYLMLFTDGNRIDLTLNPVADIPRTIYDDKLTVVLLDKDGRLPELPPPSDEDYRVRPPSRENFADCCNEFWWVSTYVAKGLWRREFLYAREHLDHYVREMLLMMLEWQVGTQTGFTVSAGKCSKDLERYLAPESWQALLATYAGASYAETWEALFAACDLFRRSALAVSEHFGYPYPHEDDRRVMAYLRQVREMQ